VRLAPECFPNVTDITLLGELPDVFVEALKNTDAVSFPSIRSLALRNCLTEFLQALSVYSAMVASWWN
jgi:hypothetical protein